MFLVDVLVCVGMCVRACVRACVCACVRACVLFLYIYSPHDYGLIDKVIDGLWLTVSNVNVHFKSPGFNSDLEISEVS